MASTNGHPDWIDVLETPFRREFRETLRSLPFQRLQRYSPPKRVGLPFGQELRILRRFLAGGSSLLDASAFSNVYLALATRAERLTFRAFVLGEPLGGEEWSELIGGPALTAWRERGLLFESGPAKLESRFRLFSTGDVVVVADPQIHTYADSFPNRVHIGQDSLNLLEFLSPRVKARHRRVIEVGPGSGMILLAIAPGRDEAVGVDINPRAVAVSTFNAELSGRANVRIHQGDIFAPRGDLGRFDLVYWNTPLLFLPDSERKQSVDGFGGDLGIEIAIRFIERLPDLLEDGGLGVVAAQPPVMDDGSNPLEIALQKLAIERGLQIDVHVMQSTWLPELRSFHRQFSIRHFENVFIEVRSGSGFRRVPPGPLRRTIDVVRARMYESKGV
ncbi:MAG TPA: methyltransferase domain-containing protein [Candidatus Eisenbacteria bacterium]|nr:methyltransferase domain-containing protein [Candidatus Eisenbacteria bacterium]